MIDNRVMMLTQIARVLGRQAPYVPESLSPFYWRMDQRDRALLITQLMEEVRRVGGQAIEFNSAHEAGEYLESVLPASLDVPVAVSDGEALDRLGIRTRLASSGRQIIPGLKEFVAEELNSGGAQTVPCEEIAPLVERYKALLMDAAVGITTADYALADTGTVVIVSGSEQHRLISLLPPAHICLLDSTRILPSLTNLLVHLSERFSDPELAPRNITCITGPSRTADIEQTITMGVHGPKSLQVIIY